MNEEEANEINKILADIDSELSMWLLDNTEEVYEEEPIIDDVRERIHDVMMLIDAKGAKARPYPS
jgi:hypothetical protein